jgi:hypothetical protein
MPDQPNTSVHDRFYELLLGAVQADRYPSTMMLDILERDLRGPERQVFAEVLMEKVEADRFPSIPMIERIARLVR